MTHTSGTEAGIRITDTLGAWLVRLFGNGPHVRGHLDGLGAIEPAEVDLIAHDLGISPSALRAAARGNPANTALLDRMLEALNIDVSALKQHHPIVLRDMQLLCGLCGSPDRCSHDLSTGRARDTHGAYCLNAATLDELCAEKR